MLGIQQGTCDQSLHSQCSDTWDHGGCHFKWDDRGRGYSDGDILADVKEEGKKLCNDREAFPEEAKTSSAKALRLAGVWPPRLTP